MKWIMTIWFGIKCRIFIWRSSDKWRFDPIEPLEDNGKILTADVEDQVWHRTADVPEGIFFFGAKDGRLKEKGHETRHG